MQTLDRLAAQSADLTGVRTTIRRPVTDSWNLLDTLEETGSVVTTLSIMGTTIVKGR